MASFSVAPSPHNPDKLELAIWMLVSIPVLVLARSLILNEWSRMLFLAGFGSLIALRLLWRISRVQRQLRRQLQQQYQQEPATATRSDSVPSSEREPRS